MFSRTTLRSVAVATMCAIGALSLPTDAFAGDRRYYRDGYRGEVYGKRYYRDHDRRYYKKRHYRKSRNHDAAGVAVAAGIIGLTVGAIIASQPRGYVQPHVRYERRYVEPRRQYRASYAPEPYSGEWYRYCANKYRSFDAASGTFMSYSGVRKLCR